MIAKDPEVAREAGTGFLITLCLVIGGVNVMRLHFGTGVCVIILALLMFVVVLRLAKKADSAHAVMVDAMEQVAQARGMGVRVSEEEDEW